MLWLIYYFGKLMVLYRFFSQSASESPGIHIENTNS